MRVTFALLAGLVVLGSATPAQARPLWVDRDSLGGPCDDLRPPGENTEATPWCTLGAAGHQVAPGDVVTVREGHYTEIQTCLLCNDNAVLQLTVSGEPNGWIRFQTAPGELVTVSGDGGATHGLQVIETYDSSVTPRFIELMGFVVRDVPGNCVQVKDTSDVVLWGLETTGCQGGAVELHRTARVTVAQSAIHDNHMDGWTSAVDLFLCLDGNVVSGNRIWANYDDDPRDSEGHGITMDTCEDAGGALIENNVIWGNEGWCMSIYQSDGAVIRNNTCWQNGLRTPSGEISILGDHHTVHNNLLVSRDGARALNIRERGDYPVDFGTITADYNLLWAPTHDVVAGWGNGNSGTLAEYQAANPGGWGVSSLQADPMLADPAGLDFSLGATSPAIDSGDNGNSPAHDILGGIRPWDGDGDSTAVTDRGAYEYLADVDPAWDAGTRPDAGVGTDSGTTPGPDGSVSGENDGGGCSCRTIGSTPSFGLWLLLGLGLWFGLRRRRA